MNEMTIEQAQAAHSAAFATHETIKARLERAKADVERHLPATAVAEGRDIEQAAEDHDAATTKVGYLIDAEEVARLKVHEAWRAVDAAQKFSIWAPRVKKAIAQRLDALREIEAARKALADAETRHAETSRILQTAIAAGYPKPDWLAAPGARLDLGRGAPGVLPPIRYRSVEEEAELWEGHQ